MARERPSSETLLDDGPTLATAPPVEEPIRGTGPQDSFLAEATSLLVGSLQLGPTLTNVAGLLAPRLADWCYVHLLGDGGAIRRVAMACADPQHQEVAALMEPSFPLRSDRTAPDRYALVLGTGQSLLVPDLEAGWGETSDPRHEARLQRLGPRSALLVALRARGRTLGAITLLRGPSRRIFDEEDLQLAERLAAAVALAVDNAQLYEAAVAARRQAEQDADRLARLDQITAALSAASSPDDVARAVVEHAMAALHASAGAVAVLDATGTGFELLHSVGYPSSLVDVCHRLVTQTVPAPHSGATPVWYNSVGELASRFPLSGLTPALIDLGAHRASAVGLLRSEGRTIGVLCLTLPDGPFGERDQALLATIAEQVAQALERARLTEAERRARAEAEAALRLSQDFMALLSHDLRGPLSVILLSSSSAREAAPAGPRGRPILQAVQSIERATRRVDRLLKDLLDLARSESGQLPLRRELHEVATFLDEAVRSHTAAATGRGLHLRAAPVRAALSVRCDRERVLQVLDILLTNAVQHTPAQGIIVVRAEQQGALLRCLVEDTGPGIAADRLGELLSPLPLAQRIHLRRGQGLGLSVAEAVVRAHGGTLGAESQLGQGSRFWFTLPLL